MDESYFAGFLAVVLTRAAERLLLVLVGAMAVYLGYNLFRQMPNARRGKGANEGEGKIELPGGVSIFLTRIGPGVFFALFGFAVIGYSVTRPIQLSFPAPSGTATGASANAGGGVSYSGVGQRDPGSAARTPLAPIAGPEPEMVVAKLNGAYQEAQKRLDMVAAVELAQVIRAAKFAVMLGRWKADWGDRDAFERWARDNGDKDPPANLFPKAILVFSAAL
jgi:branched-subunit amino acid transport protein